MAVTDCGRCSRQVHVMAHAACNSALSVLWSKKRDPGSRESSQAPHVLPASVFCRLRTMPATQPRVQLDAAEAAAGRQDLFGRPSGAQSRQLLRLTAAIPLFNVGAIYLCLMNEAALAALLDNRSRAEWRAAAAALASAALAATAAAGSGDGSSSSSARDAEADASCMPPNTFSTPQQLASLGLFPWLKSALAAAAQTVALF